jgi:hypothetical protein
MSQSLLKVSLNTKHYPSYLFFMKDSHNFNLYSKLLRSEISNFYLLFFDFINFKYINFYFNDSQSV